MICNVSVRDSYYSSYSYRVSRYQPAGETAGVDEPASRPSGPGHTPCIQIAGKMHTEPLKPPGAVDTE